jgi:hypothetical protein
MFRILGAALIAIIIYRKRVQKCKNVIHSQTADQFETLAAQMLNKFYHQNADKCKMAIRRRIPTYGNLTWLELAIAAEAKYFIAQPPVQDVFEDIW